MSTQPERKVLFQPEFTCISKFIDLQSEDLHTIIGKTITVEGYVGRTQMGKSDLYFIHVEDSSTCKMLQVVIDDVKIITKIKDKLCCGVAIRVKGMIVKSQGKKQLIELKATECDIIGGVRDRIAYPASFGTLPMATMRDLHDLRSTDRRYKAILRIRSKLMGSIYKFMDDHDFVHLDPSLLTSMDCEGAGESLSVTTFLGKDTDIKSIPLKEGTTLIDYKKDLFALDGPVTLQVSSQLGLEFMVRGMQRVFTCQKSFRAEKSKTMRHLCEFTHFECEFVVDDLPTLMDFSEASVTSIIDSHLCSSKQDIAYLESTVAESESLAKKSSSLIKERFARITYKEALAMLAFHEKEIMAKHRKELKQIPKWGDDIGTICERYICEIIIRRPVYIYHYPASLKAFYMKKVKSKAVIVAVAVAVTVDTIAPEIKIGPVTESSISTELEIDSDIESEIEPLIKVPVKTTTLVPPIEPTSVASVATEIDETVVECFDLLMPGLGELIGGSLREDDPDELVKAIKIKCPSQLETLDKYISLRKYGYFPTGGFGLGFDRLVTLLTIPGGDIRHSTPFPVAWRECYD